VLSYVAGAEKGSLDAFVRFEDAVNVLAAEAEGGLAEGVAEEAADATVPGLNPGEDAVAIRELLL